MSNNLGGEIREGTYNAHIYRSRRHDRSPEDSGAIQSMIDNLLEVSSETGTNAAFLCRGVDTDEDELGLLNGLVHVRREEEVTTASLTNYIHETRLVNGELKVWAIPSIDTSLVEINDGNPDVGTLESDDRACGAT
jgi:hypothetical protein